VVGYANGIEVHLFCLFYKILGVQQTARRTTSGMHMHIDQHELFPIGTLSLIDHLETKSRMLLKRDMVRPVKYEDLMCLRTDLASIL
jgi:hypothetical protein